MDTTRIAGLFLIVSLGMLAAPGHAQSFTVDFDTPSCSGNASVYQGIDFGGLPWTCENAGLPNQTGNSVSWPAGTTQATFKFVLPRVMTSVKAAATSGAGWMAISTDTGETFTRYITTTFQTFQTGFRKLATIVTVRYPGKGRIELDNLVYLLRAPAGVTVGIGLSVLAAVIEGTVLSSSSNSISLQPASPGVKIMFSAGASAPTCLPVTIYDAAGNTIGTTKLCAPNL